MKYYRISGQWFTEKSKAIKYCKNFGLNPKYIEIENRGCSYCGASPKEYRKGHSCKESKLYCDKLNKFFSNIRI